MAKKVITQSDKDKFKELFSLNFDDYWEGDYTHLNYEKFKEDIKCPDTVSLRDFLNTEQFIFLVWLF